MLMRKVENMFVSKALKVNSKNHLEIGGCDCVDLVNNFGTPLYVMDESLIRKIAVYIKMHWTSIITETDWYFTPARLSVQWQCAKLSSRKAWVLTWYRAESCTPRLKRDFPWKRCIFTETINH